MGQRGDNLIVFYTLDRTRVKDFTENFEKYRGTAAGQIGGYKRNTKGEAGLSAMVDLSAVADFQFPI